VATLHVRLLLDPADGPALYSYELRPAEVESVGAVDREYTAQVDQDLVEDVCAELRSTVVRSLRTTLDGPIDHVREVARWGGILYQALFPTLDGDIRELLARIGRSAGGPLLVRTNENQVPWELLHDGEQFLSQKYEFARRSFVRRRVRVGRTIETLGRALLVADPLGDLADSLHEAENLKASLEERGTMCQLRSGSQATPAEVLSDLAQGHYDLLHYSGHVAVGAGSSEASMVLHDRKLLRGRSIRAVLSGGGPPVIFLNGCESAEPLSNLCDAFMTTGSSVVVGTRFPVAEGTARALAEHFFARLADGHTAGAAMREARAEVAARADGGWAAFVLYGDPDVRIQAGGSPASGDATATEVGTAASSVVPWGEDLDPPAAAMLSGAARIAAPRRLVTSVDLLLALIAVGGPLRPALEDEGVDLVAVTGAIRALTVSASPEATPAADVRLSRTVARSLAEAGRLAAQGSHRAIAPADVAAGFVHTGGGNAGALLSQAGLPLARLASPRPAAPLGDATATAFDTGGGLQALCFAHSTQTALQAAHLLAKGSRTAISSGIMLIGFGLAGSTVLQSCLEDQEATGRKEVSRMISAADPLRAHATGLRIVDFSRRSAAVLERAVRAARERGGDRVGDVDLLSELIADGEGSARRVLDSWLVDPGLLYVSLRSLRRPTP
jgi:hypothetical protein